MKQKSFFLAPKSWNKSVHMPRESNLCHSSIGIDYSGPLSKKVSSGNQLAIVMKWKQLDTRKNTQAIKWI